jgi:hypothetical protein
MLLVLNIENFITHLQSICMKKITLLFSLFVIFNSVHAQAPVNDEPCGAIEVPVLPAEPFLIDCVPSTVYSYSNATLTPAIPNPTCGGNVYSNIRDVWYKFTTPPSGSFVINTSLSNFNTDYTMSIYTATNCNGVFTQIACNDDYNGGVFPRIQITTAPAQLVYIRIFRFLITTVYDYGEFKMCISDYSINNNPVVDNTSKVGIGTQNPLAKLDVAGSGLFRDQVTFVQAADFRSGFKIGNNAAINKVLTSDASGNASWLTPALQPDYWSLNGNDIFSNNTNNVGIGTTSPSNKLTVNGNSDFIGNVGIGTPAPVAKLHVADGNVLFTGPTTLPSAPVNPPISGEGTRMMWYPDKAAFRAGYVDNNNWDKDSIGQYSFASGNKTRASGLTSTALGFLSKAFGNYSTAIGFSANAGGVFSVALGSNTRAYGISSTAMGAQTEASAENSTAMGLINIAYAENSTVMGSYNNAYTPNSLVIGKYNENNGFNRLFEIGNGTALNARRNALTVLDNGNVGIGVTNPTYKLHLGNSNNGIRIEGPAAAGSGGSALNIGGFGDVIVDKPGTAGGRFVIKENGNIGIGIATPSSYSHGGTNRVLEIKNESPVGINNQSHLILSSNGSAGSMGGISWANTSFAGDKLTGFIGNVFETVDQTKLVFWNRNSAGLLGEKFFISGNGNATLTGTLTQNSDSRLKKKITPINNALQSLTKLSGYNYYWKNTGMDNSLQTGVLAQEVQKIFPNLVKTDTNGTLSVNYNGLIPVMIESIKEQQKQIDELKLLVQKLLKK